MIVLCELTTDQETSSIYTDGLDTNPGPTLRTLDFVSMTFKVSTDG